MAAVVVQVGWVARVAGWVPPLPGNWPAWQFRTAPEDPCHASTCTHTPTSLCEMAYMVLEDYIITACGIACKALGTVTQCRKQ